MLNCVGALTFPEMLKVPPKKIGVFICFIKLFLLKRLYISVTLSFKLAWNAVMSGLLLLVAACVCWMSYRNKYEGLLFPCFLLLMNPWFIFKR